MIYSNISYSQKVELEVSNVKVSNYKYVESGKVSMHDIQGPFLILRCKIINHTPDTVTIYPSKARYYLIYNYESETYKRELFPLAFTDNISLEIPSGQFVEFTADELMFIGTPMFNAEKKDYYIDLIRALPTMEVTYKDRKYQLSAKGVNEVKIK